MFTSEAGLIGVVDIGGTKIGVAAFCDPCNLVGRVEFPTAAFRDPIAGAEKIIGCLQNAAKQGGQPLRGVGVSCTGPVDPQTGVIGDVDLLPGWNGFPLASYLAEKLGVQVALENDADAATLAEAAWGAGKTSSRFIYVTVSTGIGAGILLDGRLYRGVSGSHPEVGHQTIDSNGPLCYCGATGCWESLASGPAMAAWVRDNSPQGGTSLKDLSAAAVCHLARHGDPLALRAVQREAVFLGIGLANLITVFCPEIIALGGGVMQSADLLLDAAREVAQARCKLVPFQKTSIVTATLGTDAALLGAARIWQSQFQATERT